MTNKLMQAYVSPLELHTRMIDLAMDLVNAGHEYQAGALSHLALSLQQDTNLEIEARDVEVPGE